MFRGFISLLALVIALAGVANADSLEEARMHYDRGLAAFALEHFAEAADEYEKAFALKPDSALLYNAAQAHRLAGHYERALKLYQSYLRVFGRRVNNRDEVQRHIEELQRTVEAQLKAEKSPPVGLRPPEPVSPAPPPSSATMPHERGPATVPPPSAPPAASAGSLPQPNALVQSAPSRERPVYKKPWFWAVVGGAVVVVGVGVGIGVGLSASKSPTASFGATTVQ